LREGDGEIELARLIVCEREMTLLSADYKAITELAAVLEGNLRGLITPRSEALAA
jgi:hypothetical protein